MESMQIVAAAILLAYSFGRIHGLELYAKQLKGIIKRDMICDSHPCQNNASCVNVQGGYTCTCTSGFTGRNCETLVCGDKHDDCFYYDNDKCVGIYASWATENCAMRCGYCTEKPLCEDILNYCPELGTDSCKNPSFIGYMRTNCRKFCNLCNLPDTISVRGNGTHVTPVALTSKRTPGRTWCRDKLANDGCFNYNDENCYGIYADWARGNCPLRCGYCEGLQSPCVDQITSCSAFNKSYCPRYKKWARYTCRKFCDHCLPPTHNPVDLITAPTTALPSDLTTIFTTLSTTTNATEATTKLIMATSNAPTHNPVDLITAPTTALPSDLTTIFTTLSTTTNATEATTKLIMATSNGNISGHLASSISPTTSCNDDNIDLCKYIITIQGGSCNDSIVAKTCKRTCNKCGNTCNDTTEFNCAAVARRYNICDDIETSKTYCPKFCNYCNPVDGYWSTWSAWENCLSTCCNCRGQQTRKRTCTNPTPSHGGRECVGTKEDHRECTDILVDGGWNIWTTWSSCSTTCGYGSRSRFRNCTDPIPINGGSDCNGTSTESIQCFLTNCPVNGGWTVWSDWSSCSVSSGNGTQTRNRMCLNPMPLYGGLNCTGNTSDQRICTRPVDGEWTEWGRWFQFYGDPASNSDKCFRRRSCSNPVPTNGGRVCCGSFMDSVDLPFNKLTTNMDPNSLHDTCEHYHQTQ